MITKQEYDKAKDLIANYLRKEVVAGNFEFKKETSYSKELIINGNTASFMIDGNDCTIIHTISEPTYGIPEIKEAILKKSNASLQSQIDAKKKEIELLKEKLEA